MPGEVSTHAVRHRAVGSALSVAGLLALLPVPPAAANNGFNFIGFGVESVGMGGADTAVARDAAALNTNPAGLAQLRARRFDGFGAFALALDIGHSDAFGNDRQISNNTNSSAGFAFAAPLGDTRLVGGLGLFAQGGAGNVYRHLATPFGTVDELSALFAFARVVPGVAWRATDALLLGVALPVTAVKAQQRVFPDTSVLAPGDPSRSFFGLKLGDATGVKAGTRIGALWKPSPAWTFGATFSPKIALDARNGTAEVNLTALGLGTVRYGEARLEGLAIAREIAVGAAWQATPATLLSLKVEHLAWSDAIRSSTLTVSAPEDPRAPLLLAQTSRIDWRDQVVWAFGVAHAFGDRHVAYAGFNYARNPAPPETLTPLLAAIARRHLTAGVSRPLGRDYRLGFAAEYIPRERIRYDNPDFPLGQRAEERQSYVALHFMLTRQW